VEAHRRAATTYPVVIGSRVAGDAPGATTGRGPVVLFRAPANRSEAGRLRRARVAVVVYFAVMGVANGVWLARIPAIKQHLHLSDGLLGLALLAAPAGLVVVVQVAGKVIHAVGSRRPTLIAGTCCALLPIGMGLASGLPALVGSLFAFGCAGGMMDVAMNSQAVEVQRRYGRPLMTSFHASYSFGGLAGALFGGLFAWAGIGPAVNFIAAGLPLAVAALLAARWLLSEKPGRSADEQPLAGPKPDGKPGARLVRRSRWSLVLLLLGLLALCSLLGEGAADGWSAVYMRDNLHTSAGLAALGYAAFAVAMAVGRLAGDKLAARFGTVRLMRGCGLLAAAGMATVLLTASPVGAIAGFALFGLGLSSTFPLLLSAAGSTDTERPSAGIAKVAGLGYTGMLGGPVLIGGLASALGLSAALVVPAALALVIAAGAAVVRAPGKVAGQPG
jgi:MFS family permease